MNRVLLLATLTIGLSTTARAETALIAVATNFVPVATALAPGFTAATGHDISITGGSTGKLYAQIAQSAPFDALLSADTMTPDRLETEGLAVPGTRFTYATGALVLWSADPARISADSSAALTDEGLRFVANSMEDPATFAALTTTNQIGRRVHLQVDPAAGTNRAALTGE